MQLHIWVSTAVEDIPAAPGQCHMIWDKRDVPATMVSVPALLSQHATQIRAELIRLVYALGRLEVAGKQIQEQLQCGDRLSMWWCSLLFEKHPKVTPQLYAALKLRAIELYVQQQDVTEIHVHHADAALCRSMEFFCASTGRKFVRAGGAVSDKAAGGGREVLRRLYYALPAPCKAVLRMAHWLWRVKRCLPYVRQACPQGTYGTIATYFPNIDTALAEKGVYRSRYWEALHDALDETAHMHVHWLFILFPSPQYTFAQCLQLRDTFAATGQDTWHFWEEFLSTQSIWRAVKRYMCLARQSRRLAKEAEAHCRFAGSQMPLWAYLGQYWKDSFAGWRALERCLQREAMCAFTQWAGVQQWTIFPMENCPWERMLTEAVHHAGHGPVYGTQHSTVRDTDYRYFDDLRTFDDADCRSFQPDGIYVNGAGAYKTMLHAGTPEHMLGTIEALRYMYLRPVDTLVPWQQSRSLLVVTSFFADEVDVHIKVLAQWMRTPEAAAWDVRIKAHPYLAVVPYLQKYFLPQEKHPQIVDGAIGAYLQGNTVVWASNSTTVALEAALMGLPVMVQLPEDDVDLCPLQCVEGVARICNVADASRALSAQTRAHIARGYLALDPALPQWRCLLGLDTATQPSKQNP